MTARARFRMSVDGLQMHAADSASGHVAPFYGSRPTMSMRSPEPLRRARRARRQDAVPGPDAAATTVRKPPSPRRVERSPSSCRDKGA